MGDGVRAYEKQLAEVAAGRRAQVDHWTEVYAEAEIARERDIQRRQDKALLETAERQARAAEEAHWQAQEQFEFEREAHDAAMEAARESREAQMRAIAEAEEYAASRHEEVKRDKRIRSSPTFAAVSHLAKLRAMERRLRENQEVARILEAAVVSLEALRLAAQTADAIMAIEAAAIRFEERQMDLEADLIYENERSRARRTLEASLAEVEANAEQLADYGITLNPVTWLGQHSNQRQHYKDALARSQGRYAQAQIDFERIKRLRPPQSASSKRFVTRAQRISSLCEELAIDGVLTKIDIELKAWFDSEARSEAMNDVFGRFAVELPFEPDYDMCVLLDRARAAGETVISYPGLGVVPNGASLVAMLENIHRLQKLLPDFQWPEEEWIKPPKGFREREILIKAVRGGLLLSKAEEEACLIKDDDAEPELVHAAAVIDLYNDAEITTVQRYLGVEYARAASLIEQLRSMNGSYFLMNEDDRAIYGGFRFDD